MNLVLLTGEKGSGKTTACCRLAELALEHGLALGGVIAPARYDDQGVKSGIMLRDLLSSEERLLAQVVPAHSTDVTVGRYAFDDQTTAWGLACIVQAMQADLAAVIIDEIGPLELLYRAGFAPALELLGTMQARTAILIVRPSLIADLAGRLAAFKPRIMRLTPNNRDALPRCLLTAVQR